MIKYVYLLTILLLLAIKSLGQQTFEFVKKVPVTGQYLTVDNLGNIITYSDKEIFKYRPNGTLFNRFSNKALGSITCLDATNPLKLVLFYKDLSRVVFLDNTLTENGASLNLEDFELELTNALCSSYDNGLWFFDTNNFRLIRFKQDFTVSVEVKNINQFVGSAIFPTFMLEREGTLYLYDATKGVMVFDIFGTYIKTIPLLGLTTFQVIEGNIVYLKDGKLKQYNQKTFTETEMVLPIEATESFAVLEDKIYLLKNNEVTIYTVKSAQ